MNSKPCNNCRHAVPTDTPTTINCKYGEIEGSGKNYLTQSVAGKLINGKEYVEINKVERCAAQHTRDII